jgi:DNA-binding MarR family transcriptional regulator
VRLTDEGQRLLRQARPRFRAYAEAVEARLGGERIEQLRDSLGELREAMEQEVSPE